MRLPSSVKIVEVGPRDGLQNETAIISTKTKVEFINLLSQTGLSVIEIGSFVSPKWVPQMADSFDVCRTVQRNPQVQYSALVPNLKGLELAQSANVNSIAVFTAASETFTKKNINCTIEESLQQFREIINLAKKSKLFVRGYISCVLGCPYESEIATEKVVKVADELFKMGCDEISLGDTIGVGTPNKVQQLIQAISKKIPLDKIAVHFHDTYGQAIANIYAALEQGISIIDSSVAGLGGCPYAPGASGNVATEDVAYLLNGLGIKTNVDINKLLIAADFITSKLNHPTRSKAGQALNTKNKDK